MGGGGGGSLWGASDAVEFVVQLVQEKSQKAEGYFIGQNLRKWQWGNLYGKVKPQKFLGVMLFKSTFL